ncbi:FMN-binding negative transcriptional regulator [Methylophilus sp. YYY-1]|uniref:FMN-binding negative transcriptional regulator n=1 Tax=Methylophilus sp. YYY-1 TaxID=2682087 RepID=UPI0023B2495A|nr:FMN-binding negative transcriptional regulator [Methylophilus sp. YYY-1]MDF0379230.1 FMN-binding negative transcriptional regulator [Methylophilus sp. YYY-1]
MYLPKHFSASSDEALLSLIHRYPFATLIASLPTGLEVNHLPLSLQAGRLCGHLARANPLWQHWQQNASAQAVMAVFHGPHAYVSPSWYPSKTQRGKGVPTWNYVVVHVQGQLRLIEEADWLREHLRALTAQHEAEFEQPWQLEDAPADDIERMMQATVGISIEITQLTGKWKVSQNQPLENRQGVWQGLQASEAPHARDLAAIVQAVNGLNGK